MLTESNVFLLLLLHARVESDFVDPAMWTVGVVGERKHVGIVYLKLPEFVQA